MADVTTRYGLPYQEIGDAPDGPALGQDLAEATEAAIAAIDDRNSAGLSGSSGANTATFSNTTPATQGTNVGVIFTAPPSGRVLLICHAYVRNRNASYATYAGGRIKTGGVFDSGTIVHDPGAEPNAKITVQEFVGQVEASCVQLVYGLTPGATYNALVCGWVNNAAGSGDLYNRRLDIVKI